MMTCQSWISMTTDRENSFGCLSRNDLLHVEVGEPDLRPGRFERKEIARISDPETPAPPEGSPADRASWCHGEGGSKWRRSPVLRSGSAGDRRHRRRSSHPTR